MDYLTWTIIFLVVIAVTFGGLSLFGAWRWREATRALVASINAAKVEGGVAYFDAHEIADLPPPVRRYFELALTDGQRLIRSVDLDMTGTFNMSLDAPQWKKFTSQQRVVTDRPGFVWDGRIMMAPALPVRVHDAYIAGDGVLRPALLGLVSLGTVQGTGEIARGELMRWMAEAVWYPTALLPSQGVVWRAVDATSAQATMTDGTITLTMLFRFGADGLASGIRVEARGGLVDGETVMMPWEGRFHDYRPIDGMMIPFHGEVAWITPQGERPYFRGDVTQLVYSYGEQPRTLTPSPRRRPPPPAADTGLRSFRRGSRSGTSCLRHG